MTSGRAAIASSIVASVERPSTMITSSTIAGSRRSTQPTLPASLSVGMTAETRGDAVAA
jgi:hypothetical protein